MKKVFKSVENLEFEIVASKGIDCRIKFLESGYECRVRKSLIEKGLVCDPTAYIKEQEEWVPFHEEYTNNSGEKFYAFLRKKNKIRIYFENTSYCAEVYMDNAKAGKVSNPYAKSVYGVGSSGIINKKIPYWKQARQLWNNMLKRCYSEKDSRGYYGSVIVDERWLVFENFLSDIKHLEGFEGWLNGADGGLPYNLDKDFIKPDNKIYSRHFCMFLPENFNKSLGKKGKTI